MLLALMVCSMNAWSYRLTNTYTIEAKFKINVISAGLIFAGASGTQGNFYMWQFNVGADGTQSLFRPHHWNPGALLDEKGTGDVRLNTSDWFVTTIEVTDGNVARTYLRKDGSDIDVLIDERSGDFAYGLVGARQDHDFNLNESSTFDYIRITDENGDVLYAEEFNETDGNWSNDPLWDAENGTLTVEGRNLSERRYFPQQHVQGCGGHALHRGSRPYHRERIHLHHIRSDRKRQQLHVADLAQLPQRRQRQHLLSP